MDPRAAPAAAWQSFSTKYAAILRAIYYLEAEQRTALLRKADSKLIKHLCECALNVLCGNMQLSDSRKRRLRKYVKLLRSLASTESGNLTSKKS